LPKLPSSKKRMRQSEKARLRNKSARSRLRSTIKKVLSATSKTDAEGLINQAQSVIDKSTQKGVIHPNAAARYKSRLVRHVTAMQA